MNNDEVKSFMVPDFTKPFSKMVDGVKQFGFAVKTVRMTQAEFDKTYGKKKEI